MYQETSMQIETILDKKRINNRMYYLIIWKGLDQQYKCWVPEVFLTLDQLQQFQNNQQVAEVQPKPKLHKSTQQQPNYPIHKYLEISPNSNQHKYVQEIQSNPIENQVYENQEQFEVEDIIKMRVTNGKKQYRIKWLGYPHSQNTWEPQQHLSEELKKGYQEWIKNNNKSQASNPKNLQNRKNIIAKAHQQQKAKLISQQVVQQQSMQIIDQSPFEQTKKVKPVKQKKNTVPKEKTQTLQTNYMKSALNLMKMPIEEVKGINMFAEEEGNIYLQNQTVQKAKNLKSQLMATIFSLRKPV